VAPSERGTMKLIRLTNQSDEPVHLDAAHITSI
jgi:hypothetical protein